MQRPWKASNRTEVSLCGGLRTRIVALLILETLDIYGKCRPMLQGFPYGLTSLNFSQGIYYFLFNVTKNEEGVNPWLDDIFDPERDSEVVPDVILERTFCSSESVKMGGSVGVSTGAGG